MVSTMVSFHAVKWILSIHLANWTAMAPCSKVEPPRYGQYLEARNASQPRPQRPMLRSREPVFLGVLDPILMKRIATKRIELLLNGNTIAVKYEANHVAGN